MLDRFDCYELCVQSPRHLVSFLEGLGLAAGAPLRALGEDFCGTAALSRRWVAEGARRGEVWSARAVDNDASVLAKARAGVAQDIATQAYTLGHAPVLVQRDCTQATGVDPCDVIFIGNFSIGYLHERAALLAYLRACKRRLDAAHAGFGGGLLVFDVYGGVGAFALGALQRQHPGKGREIIQYTWLHETADPRTGLVTNSISFRVVIDGEIVQDLPRAFVYHWRLWSLPEVHDALREAGFADVQLYSDINVAPGQMPRPHDGQLPSDYVLCVVAR